MSLKHSLDLSIITFFKFLIYQQFLLIAANPDAMHPSSCNPSREINCDQDSKFRTIDGTCNNLESPHLGSAGSKLTRELAGIPNLFNLVNFLNRPSQECMTPNLSQLDAVNYFGVTRRECACTSKCVKETPVLRPAARLISREFHTNDDDANDQDLTLLVALFGQFLDHDMSLTTEEEACPCCVEGKDNSEKCAPIELPIIDQLTKGLPCLPFTRSILFCEETGNGHQREQVNVLTCKFSYVKSIV